MPIYVTCCYINHFDILRIFLLNRCKLCRHFRLPTLLRHPQENRRRTGQGAAKVVETDGGVTGYTTDIGFTGHAVGEGNENLKALIPSVEQFSGPGLLVPIGNAELMRWSLDNGLTVFRQLILMDTHPGCAEGRLLAVGAVLSDLIRDARS